MNRRAFLKSGTAATAFLLVRPVWCADRQDSQATDPEILAQCKTRIDQHRAGDGVVIVRDTKGKPVPGAKIVLEQLRHDFRFGCNFFMFGRCGDPALEEQYRQRFAAVFNYATLGFYWRTYEAERGQPNYDYTDTVVEWSAAHGIECKGHPLVWDHPAGSPRWLPDDHQEIQRLSNARVREIISRYKGRIDIWDVVNEATHLPDKANQTKMASWGAALGPVQYTTEPLDIAREANPRATFIVNDYRIDPRFYRLLDQLRRNGRLLFDVIGIQSHMHGGVWPLKKVWDTCDQYARLGLPLHFTETTIVSGPKQGPGEQWGETTAADESRQADAAANFYTVLFAHPAVQALTWWDFADRGAWQRAPAGWLRKDLSPKPVYERLASLIKQAWWTRVNGRTDGRGRFATRAFFGTHRITVETEGGQSATREVVWAKDQPNEVEFIF